MTIHTATKSITCLVLPPSTTYFSVPIDSDSDSGSDSDSSRNRNRNRSPNPNPPKVVKKLAKFDAFMGKFVAAREAYLHIVNSNKKVAAANDARAKLSERYETCTTTDR